MRLERGILLFVAILALASCKPPRRAEGRDPSRGPSTLTIKGSDTMVMLTPRQAEAFMEKNPAASRPMKASEKARVEERRGRPAVEHAVALDGIAIYVHESNPVPHLTLDQIKRIYEGRIRDWSEVGGSPGRITLYSRENSSGTY